MVGFWKLAIKRAQKYHLAYEVQRRTLRSDPGGWGARTFSVELQRAHCAGALAAAVQRCTLRSGAGKENWRGTWQRGLARSLASLAKRMGGTLARRIGKEEQEEEEKEKEE